MDRKTIFCSSSVDSLRPPTPTARNNNTKEDTREKAKRCQGEAVRDLLRASPTRRDLILLLLLCPSIT
eukprot:scaffold5007_cov85-Amphora_coffeaeformis.AAC.1